ASVTPVATPSTSTGGGISPGALGDTTPPSISNIGVLVSGAYSTIFWQTNEGSISWLIYGTSTAYGLEIKTATSTASHSLTLLGLSPSTAYHYQLKSKDSVGNVGTYTDKTFTTLAMGEQPKVVEEAPKVVAKPISEMTSQELNAKILEIQQLIIKILIQLIANLQSQIAALR
ncbi:hypothetical protein KJ636_04185, partial [Patescibacteria group bacterium]|nr:hypothetical protein [Patescibacteria group bacterium]